ncbi:MAG TPA: chromosome partitioning protein ParA [Leptospiraceae bacterium]|nr:chromosome partitioning protein ParA [Spirochaetaceae bacterium]HBS04501.1 chromosome partitioning protein ParA [Leptospiraceae bacterium]|tara:strand:+ start:92648 stop:93409 length:762 start_codon:yes stop_codon:yes gene_type:complete
MAEIIAVANQKGGVGKTTTTINLAAFLGKMGQQVLIVDVDPQGNASSGLGLDIHKIEKTTYEVFLEEVSLAEAILRTETQNVSVVPANVNLSGIEMDLLQMEAREYKLQAALKQVAPNYDWVFIDCPPNLGILTLNALCAADGVMIPLQTEYYALEGLTQLMRVIGLVQQSLNPSLELKGVVLTMYDQRTSLAHQVVDDVKQHFGDKVFSAVVPRNVKLSEAPSFGKSILEYAPDSSGAKAYEQLASEVMKNG